MRRLCTLSAEVAGEEETVGEDSMAVMLAFCECVAFWTARKAMERSSIRVLDWAALRMEGVLGVRLKEGGRKEAGLGRTV